MKKFLLFSFILFFGFSYGQENIVAKKINEYMLSGKHFTEFPIFTKKQTPNSFSVDDELNQDLTYLKLHEISLNSIVSSSPEFISLEIPFKDELIKLLLYRNEIFTDDFKIRNEQWIPVNYQAGVYYRGIIEGEENSLAAFSFFDNDIMGIISSTQNGNVVIGKTEDEGTFISFSDVEVLGTNPFTCSTDESLNKGHSNTGFELAPDGNESERCVRIYFEIGYDIYEEKENSPINTLNWFSAVFNNVSTLYNNDGINVAIGTIQIWTTPDPYTGSDSEKLDQMVDLGLGSYEDLAHLIKLGSSGVAYLDVLCDNSHNVGYSGVFMEYSNVPTFSWTVSVITHEMGHNLGSPHTHACAWNGNNTAIDGCGYNAGYSGCPGPIPPEGGTIMSYCHMQSVGVNFNLGFGPQPKALLLNRIANANCLGTDCTNPSENYRLIITQSEPFYGGNTSGDGSYLINSTVTVNATPSLGFEFISWTDENGNVKSNDQAFTFIVTENSYLKANFEAGPEFCHIDYPIGLSDLGNLNGAALAVDFPSQSTEMTVEVVKAYFYYEVTTMDISFYKDASGSPGSHLYGPITVTPYSQNYIQGREIYEVIFNMVPFEIFLENENEGELYWIAMSSPGEDNYWIASPGINNGTRFFGSLDNYDTWVDVDEYGFNLDGSLFISGGCLLPESFEISTEANPLEGGSTVGGGTYYYEDIATVTAVANEGYAFMNWTENGSVVSEDISYVFTVIESRTLTAQFSLNEYVIVTESNPSEGGVTSGDGAYNHGESVTITATANEDYYFINWTENGTVVSEDISFAFTITEDRTLTANFEKELDLNEEELYISELYPNPYEDRMFYRTLKESILKVRFFDLSGRFLSQKEGNNHSEMTIFEDSLPSGTYLMRIYTDKSVKTFKIIKN